MATFINNPGATVPQESGAAAAGWALAAVLLAFLILGALFIWPGYARNAAPSSNPSETNINVSVPTPTAPQTDTEGEGGGGSTPSQTPATPL
jgi:hypothetical protein